MNFNFTEVERVESISAKDFQKYYVKPQKPVVVERITEDWPAYEKWNFEYIKQVEVAGKDFTSLSIKYWKEQTGEIKDRFSKIIGDATVLSDQKRADIKEIIFQFQQPVLYHDTKQLFDPKSLLEGFRLGNFQLFGDSNKIDLKKLKEEVNQILVGMEISREIITTKQLSDS